MGSAHLVLWRKLSASHFWGDCRQHGVTVFQYVSEICRYVLSQPKNKLDRVHSVRMTVGNGMRADVGARFLERQGDVRFCEIYGTTEGNVGFVNVACGRDLPFLRLLIKYALVKYEHEKDGTVRDDKGFCIPLPRDDEGRAGMEAVILEEGHSLNGLELYRHVEALELTSTFKQIKTHLLQEGFNPALIRAPQFYLDNAACSYTPLTRQIYEGIVSDKVKL
ncbi:long-chain fatty acid transport protein 2-like [Lampetra fluviatilis]